MSGFVVETGGYIRSSKLQPPVFYRDVVHATEIGEQMLVVKISAGVLGAPAARGRLKGIGYRTVTETGLDTGPSASPAIARTWYW